jgi:hypothetical protein
MCFISPNILTVLANFLGIIIQPCLKGISCDCGNTTLFRVWSHKVLTKVASLSLNSVTKTGIQCSNLLHLSRTDTEGLPRLQQLSGNLPRGSLRYWEFPQSHWSHPQGSPSVLLVSFVVSKYLPLYRINMRLFLSQISSLLPTHTLLIQEQI